MLSSNLPLPQVIEEPEHIIFIEGGGVMLGVIPKIMLMRELTSLTLIRPSLLTSADSWFIDSSPSIILIKADTSLTFTRPSPFTSPVKFWRTFNKPVSVLLMLSLKPSTLKS